MKRIAITYRFPDKAPPYTDAVREAGMEPVLINPDDGVTSIGGYAGLLVSGGTDIDPALYGQAPHPLSQEPDRPRDEMELCFVREALERNLPILAICRGAQLLNVAHRGGTLVQHIDNHAVRDRDPAIAVHEVELMPGSRLAGIFDELRLPVNSRHHQAVADAGEGLVISARSADGVIEGVERPEQRFVVGVQWHPEDQIQRYPAQLRLFEALREAI